MRKSSKYNLKIITCFIFLLFTSVYSAFSQTNPGVPTKRVLEVSLMSLRESALKLEKKNAWLSSEITNLRQQVANKKNELDIIRGQKTILLIGSGKNAGVNNVRPITSLEKKQIIDQSLSLLSTQKQGLNNSLESRTNQADDFKNQITIISGEINDLKNKKKSMCFEMDENIYMGSKKKMQEQIVASEGLLKKYKNNLLLMDKKFKGPIKAAGDLQEQNNILTKQLLAIDNNLNVLYDRNKNLELEILGIKDKKDLEKAAIVKQVADLDKRKNDLDEVILKAKTSLAENQQKFDSNLTKDADLRQNLDIIKKENLELKEELESLANVLSNL